MKVEYELGGEYIFYLILSFVIPILLSMTCCLWCQSEQEISPRPENSFRTAADLIEYQSSQMNEKERKEQAKRTKLYLILAWVILFIVIYCASPSSRDNEKFDPFFILNIHEETSVKEIQHVYRELSKQHHPDRGGDPEKFKEIAKAHQILTDEKAKENWKKYGNPDGPREVHVGFAISKWLVDRKNSMFILCAYTSFFIIVPLLCYVS
ncbi:unnamed protein product [Rotaria sordida]|uniref:J domain-containing protein n=2 Tax=Rotaria sordida TaxID=392033 RepID=A0A820BMJ5_9BILA|nr:unnamed protein product [Rotaria sordida]CAF1517891.1 unnamed protein product [Rotaria sordida]CAF1547569.1 unnamed protein product [Rotaria sordida]CAF4172796.1 unnamed protein product [Rotaria sordida]CAF4209677.1 unnamed protein product [Rotaria sordida]